MQQNRMLICAVLHHPGSMLARLFTWSILGGSSNTTALTLQNWVHFRGQPVAPVRPYAFAFLRPCQSADTIRRYNPPIQSAHGRHISAAGFRPNHAYVNQRRPRTASRAYPKVVPSAPYAPAFMGAIRKKMTTGEGSISIFTKYMGHSESISWGLRFQRCGAK
jgi:hypothetical protein